MSVSATASIDFYRRLAAHAGVPFVTLEFTEGAEETFHPVDPRAAELLSAEVCRQFGIMPIGLHEGTVTIASAEPVQYMAYDVAAALTGRAVNFVIAPADQLERAIDAALVERPGTGVGAVSPVSEPMPSEPAVGEMMGPPLRLGDLLVAWGLVTPDLVEAALAEQQRTGDRIGRIFVHHNLVDDRTLTEALAQQLEMPVVDLREFAPDPAILAIIPEPVMRELGVLPVAVEEGKLYVAADDVPPLETISQLAEYTHLDIRVLLAPRQDIEAVIRRAFGPSYRRCWWQRCR